MIELRIFYVTQEANEYMLWKQPHDFAMKKNKTGKDKILIIFCQSVPSVIFFIYPGVLLERESGAPSPQKKDFCSPP